MSGLLRSFFGREDATIKARDQLFEAERLMLEHTAAAEHHEALATMYTARVERLREFIFDNGVAEC